MAVIRRRVVLPDWRASPAKKFTVSEAAAAERLVIIRGSIRRSKKLKKTQKKACQPFARSLNGGDDATNTSGKPFKKTLKKVKKKLVSAAEI